MCAYKKFMEYFLPHDNERLDGLDESHFAPMNQEERVRAFDCLLKMRMLKIPREPESADKYYQTLMSALRSENVQVELAALEQVAKYEASLSIEGLEMAIQEFMRSKRKLDPLYRFFETYGTERLNGLDETYFFDLNEEERKEAWDFLEDGFLLSSERLTGLYLLDKSRAVDLFKQTISSPVAASPFPAERQASESNRLLMLRYINSVEPDEKYVTAMGEFAISQFASVRAEFAQSLPTRQLSRSAVNALIRMIFTETERIPRTSAITKIMAIHGMDYDMNNPLYKSIYLSLRSNDSKEKIAAIKRLELNKFPGVR